jgi:hypothetical protein
MLLLSLIRTTYNDVMLCYRYCCCWCCYYYRTPVRVYEIDTSTLCWLLILSLLLFIIVFVILDVVIVANTNYIQWCYVMLPVLLLLVLLLLSIRSDSIKSRLDADWMPIWYQIYPFSNQLRFASISIRFDSICTSCDVLVEWM